jgi:hypothetical protein
MFGAPKRRPVFGARTFPLNYDVNIRGVEE